MKLKPIFLLAFAPLFIHAEEKLSVYFIGNSLTASTTLDRVHELFAERDIDLQFGSQLSGGKSLFRHLNYQSEPDQKWIAWETNVANGDTFEPDPNPYDANVNERFGLFDAGLAQHQWDAVVLQPFLNSMHNTYAGANGFIELSLENKTSEDFYIYATWPRRSKDKETKEPVDLDYPGEWQAKYTATMEDTKWTAKNNAASRDFFEQLLGYLNEAHPDLKQPVRLIPAGDVLFAIDAKIKAGALPGLEVLAKEKPEMLPGLDEDTDFSQGVNILYADAVHLNPIPHKEATLGIYISGTTVFTVLSGQNPVGMSGAPYGLDAPQYQELLRAVQQTIWDVVSSDPLTGVNP